MPAHGTGAQALVQALRGRGVELVFGLPGVHNLPLWEALADSGIRLVGVRHEQSAVYAADGYARATGRLGIALTTTGPGAANAVAATGEAWASHSPVLVIATDIPSTLRRDGVCRGALHETRGQARMFAPIVKRAFEVDAAREILTATLTAADMALAAPSGPTYLQVPTDLLSEPTDIGGCAVAVAAAADGVAEDQLAAATAILTAAGRPLIWVGRGAVASASSEAVLDLAERLCAPIIETYGARGLARRHPCGVGLPPHTPSAGELWDDADLVIGIGTDFDGMMTQNWRQPQPPQLVTINIDPVDAAVNYDPDIALVGDAKDLCVRLAAGLPPADPGRVERLAADLATRRERALREIGEDEPQAVSLLAALEDTLEDSDLLVADMCIPGYWAAAFHRFGEARKLQYPVGWGTLGFAFPASIGAALAGVGRTVCLCGDGGFLFAAGELATVAQERVPLTVVILDDGGYGMLRFDQEHAGSPRFGVDLVSPDFGAWARATDIPATHVDGVGDEFAEALARALGSPGPSLLHVSAAMKPPSTTSPRWYRAAS